MALNIKKGRLITFLDIFLIFVIFIFLRNYMGRNNKNSTKLIKDKVTYTLLINSQKIKKDELLNIRIKLENRDKNQKFLEFKKAVPFNYVIEKDGKDILIGFNPKFLIDALKVIDDEVIHMYLMNPKAPCFIRDDEENYTYLILPVNIRQNQNR